MTLGFSYVGLIFILMLSVPNIIWTKNMPVGYSSSNENKVLVLCERIGQAAVSASVLVFSDFNINQIRPWSIFLLIAFLVMVLYEAWWIRYFKSERNLSDFYSSFCGVPVAGASLPIIAFFILGIYGRNPFLLISIIILGIGHIGIHLQHRNEVIDKKASIQG